MGLDVLRETLIVVYLIFKYNISCRESRVKILTSSFYHNKLI